MTSKQNVRSTSTTKKVSIVSDRSTTKVPKSNLDLAKKVPFSALPEALTKLIPEASKGLLLNTKGASSPFLSNSTGDPQRYSIISPEGSKILSVVGKSGYIFDKASVMSNSLNPDPIKYLSQKSIQLLQEPIQSDLKVPPTTPRDLIQDFEVTSVPANFPKLEGVKLPLVREIGVKESIRKLADIYGCKQFHVNLIQFWFLDFMTDCLWKVQDEFQFPENHQKVVLEWVAYVFNLVRAPQLNLSRKQIFRIFNDAMALAEQFIESGCADLPLPDELFELDSETQLTTEDDTKSESSSSSVLLNTNEPDINNNDSYLAIELQDGVRFFDLPKKVCPWDTDDDRLSSTIETVSENEVVIIQPEEHEQEQPESSQRSEELVPDINVDLVFEDFYKPDLSTPPRFIQSDDSMYDSFSISYESDSLTLLENVDEDEGSSAWVISKKKTQDVTCRSKLFDAKKENTEKTEKVKEEEALQAWYDYHLWQFRKLAMDDPVQGWVFGSDEKLNKPKEPVIKEQEIQVDMDQEPLACQQNLMEYVKAMHNDMKQLRENRFINTCVIMAIKQIVYDYFYDSFQFCLIRMAYRYPQFLITQELNQDWCIPKRFRHEIKRPKPKKRKVEKRKVSKDEMVKKPSPPKIAPEKPIKRDSKDRKESKIDMSKEEAERQEKLREEMLRQEELERIAEENRTLMFPLTDAISDSFFEVLFPGCKIKKKNK